ncbi:MAG TPA: bifunctional 4-hydroxy-2-oxoglutarate aldolase/2-dehydro-3-deoxy-phosphogluconate aldolase [Terriglobia bacterium]|nr:bifunctional 4-hydroxy-2-oxoglutarate aldolase/2-dehydro-3-deoxy-phosphogluconate aldolase [Terriglobia bacterium]
MTKVEICQRIQEIGVIPAIWVTSAEDACFAAESLEGGGIPILEVTITGPEAIDLIAHTVSHHSKVIVGAGTVLDTETAKRAAAAGANFLTAPGFDYSLVEYAAKENVAIVPGALTPTEVITAWRVGADFVKVFPCSQVGGDKYIKALKKAVPQIPLIAAGGVTQHTATGFILAGAAAVGVGTDLIPPEAIARRQAERIQELSHRFLAFVNDARARLAKGKLRPPPAKR